MTKNFELCFSEALDQVESRIDAMGDPDRVEADRTAAGLQLTLGTGDKIILSAQPALEELWVAARQGGFHLQWRNDGWYCSAVDKALWDLLLQLMDINLTSCDHGLAL